MAAIKRLEDLEAWRRSRTLVREIYAACSHGALKRNYVMRDQLTRAALSTMTNVAEGFGRKTDVEFARFLDIARGSAVEVQSLLYAALDTGHINADHFKKLYELSDEAISIIAGLTAYLRKKTK